MQLVLESVRDAREAARAIESFLADSALMEIQKRVRLEAASEAANELVEALGELRG